MRLVVCDDNRILGEALAAALTAWGHEVPAVTTSVAAGVAAVAEHMPEVCLLDLGFPDGEDCREALAAMRRGSPGTAVVIFSGVHDPAVVPEMRRLGAAGFLSKAQNVSQIARALDAIASGDAVFEPVRPRMVAAAPRTAPVLDQLTPREKEVLRRIVAGQSTSRMAREMIITTSTLRTYVKNLLAKLGTHSRLEAAALASQEGLLAELTA